MHPWFSNYIISNISGHCRGYMQSGCNRAPRGHMPSAPGAHSCPCKGTIYPPPGPCALYSSFVFCASRIKKRLFLFSYLLCQMPAAAAQSLSWLLEISRLFSHFLFRSYKVSFRWSYHQVHCQGFVRYLPSQLRATAAYLLLLWTQYRHTFKFNALGADRFNWIHHPSEPFFLFSREGCKVWCCSVQMYRWCCCVVGGSGCCQARGIPPCPRVNTCWTSIIEEMAWQEISVLFAWANTQLHGWTFNILFRGPSSHPSTFLMTAEN